MSKTENSLALLGGMVGGRVTKIDLIIKTHLIKNKLQS